MRTTIFLLMLMTTPLAAADLPRADAPPDAATVTRSKREVKTACDSAIADWAKPFDPIKVDTMVTGSIQSEGGDSTAVLDVKIDYDRQGGVETRKARIECTVRDNGTVAVAEAHKN